MPFADWIPHDSYQPFWHNWNAGNNLWQYRIFHNPCTTSCYLPDALRASDTLVFALAAAQGVGRKARRSPVPAAVTHSSTDPTRFLGANLFENGYPISFDETAYKIN